MVKPTYSESRRSLEKWRRKKDKVLEVDPVERPVESVYPTEDPPGGYKRPPAIPRVFPTMGESSGDLTYLPIQAPSPKGEPTMVPIRAPSPKGEATMIPIQSRPKGEATMMPGQSRRQSADPTMVPIQAPQKGEATMMPGESRRRSAEPDMMAIPALPSKGEATMRPGQSRRRPGHGADPDAAEGRGVLHGNARPGVRISARQPRDP